MTNQSFNYIEDYIEYIGGYNPTHKSKSVLISLGMHGTSPLSLARYDVSIVDSLCTQILYKQIGFTVKQAELAKTLIYKYRKQLEKQGINIPETLDKFRLPIRTVSNNFSVNIDNANKKFVVSFPYDTHLISKFRECKTSENISANFNYDTKVWVLPMTEYSLNWIKVICPSNRFHYEEEIDKLFNEILELENAEYKIELCEIDNQLTITNASPQLIQYIQDKIGEIDYSNITKLIDLSTTLGYTVDSAILQRYVVNDSVVSQLLTQKTTKIKMENFDLDQIMEYAEAMGRTPVYSYLNSHRQLAKYKHPKLIQLSNSWPDSNTSVPLFISQSPILIGVRKNTMLKLAEKIIILDHEIVQNHN